MTYEVIALDWQQPNVIATFTDRGAADRYAEAMDSSALRCYVRDTTPVVTEPTPWEGDCALETVKSQPRCRAQCPHCRIMEERRQDG